MRLDKFLKVSRIIKRRTIAAEACQNQYISVNGKVAKASSWFVWGTLSQCPTGVGKPPLRFWNYTKARPKTRPAKCTRFWKTTPLTEI